ncbi:MAG: DNA polymerase I [Deltaproteobacteria bacterium]|nr:DNA polymerase I [Deltaproteobacteria bacterium]
MSMQILKTALYLIDASSYLYRAFHALPPLSSPQGLPTNAALGFTTMLLKLLRIRTPEYLAAVFDAPGPNFRDSMYSDYKAHRPGMPTDLAVQIPMVHEIVAGLRIADLSVSGVEADDVIATIARQNQAAGFQTVIVTGDKDLMQVVDQGIWLWDTMRDRWFDVEAVRERCGVAPQQVVDLIGLMGDAVDNIPGVKGIGEKTATKLIQRFGSIDGVLENLEKVETFAEIRSPKRVAELLRDQKEQALLSRRLAVLRCDLELAYSLEQFRVREFNSERLRPILLRLGFQRLLKEIPAVGPTVSTLAQDVDEKFDWSEFLQFVRRSGQVAIATAGDGGNCSANDILFAVKEGPVYKVNLAKHRLLGDLLVDSQVEKVGHDLKRDFRNMGTCSSIEPAFDVMIASYLLEASSTHRLEDLAADIEGINLPSFRGEIDQLASGVSLLLSLRQKLGQQMNQRGLGPLFTEVEMPLVAVLARMEHRGIQLDLASLSTLSLEMTSRMTALMIEIFELAGGEFNIASPQQLRQILFDRLHLSARGIRRGKTGLSTDVDVLKRLSRVHPLPAKILEYRTLSKLKSTYVDALPLAVNRATGRLHTTFNQAVAATGRLSSSNPNLQNIPIRGVEGQRIRAAFVAPPNRCLLVADYSQIELRLLAHLSGDSALIAAFAADEDVHARTAAEVFGVLPGTVTRDMRRAAKVINFGIIYGMGANALARELEIPTAQADLYIQSYFARYVGVRDYIKATIEEAHHKGYVTTLLGRRRSLPALASADRNTVQAAERTAANTPIQGSAADLIKLAMVRIERRLTREQIDGELILQVHDELVLEVSADAVTSATTVVREEMEGVVSLKVPLKVELGMGNNWAEAH